MYIAIQLHAPAFQTEHTNSFIHSRPHQSTVVCHLEVVVGLTAPKTRKISESRGAEPTNCRPVLFEQIYLNVAGANVLVILQL